MDVFILIQSSRVEYTIVLLVILNIPYDLPQVHPTLEEYRKLADLLKVAVVVLFLYAHRSRWG